ncbi:hypothetical protein ACLMAB_03005 [Brevibacillus laterosporus]
MSNMVMSKVTASAIEKWNRESAIKHTHHREKMIAILKLHGVPIQTYVGVIPMQTFEVHLFQHQVAAIYRIEERTVWILQEARTIGKTRKEEVSQTLDETEKIGSLLWQCVPLRSRIRLRESDSWSAFPNKNANN